MDLEPLTTELSTLASDVIMTDLSSATSFIYTFTLDDIIGFFIDLSYPSELSEMSGTMTDLNI